MAPTHTTGPRWRPETRASDYRLCDGLVTMNSTSNNKERKPDLMESMIDGGFEREGGSGSIVSYRELHHLLPPHPHPPIMWIRTRRLFNSSFERRVDRGESSGGGVRGEGLAGCLCCAVAGRPSRDSARLRRGETRQGLRGGLMPCNED